MTYQLKVRQDAKGGWRIYIDGQDEALRENQYVLGGMRDQAIGDAERLAKEDPDLFAFDPQVDAGREDGLVLPPWV